MAKRDQPHTAQWYAARRPRRTQRQLEALVRAGYRRTSNAHALAARVDREDWAEFCERKGYPVDADWYRRCLSKDKIELQLDDIRHIPPSSHDPVGYRPLPSEFAEATGFELQPYQRRMIDSIMTDTFEVIFPPRGRP